MAESLSMAFLVLLETLSPAERAAYLLREVFGYEFDEIAALIDKTPVNVRQIVARARKHVENNDRRFRTTTEQAEALANRFFEACRSGDVDAIESMLAPDAVLYSDGGGKRTAALNPIVGRDKIIRFANGRRAKQFVPLAVERVRINGQPGFVLRQSDGPETMAFEIANGVITAIYDVRNPDKLHHLNRA